MKYEIKTISHDEQKYETVGDYSRDAEGACTILVSEMPNKDYEFLVGLHEFVEAYLVAKNGVSDESITAFDIEFEKNRPEGNLDEPGDSRAAPYFKEHRIATSIERVAASLIGDNWSDYEKTVNSLYQHAKAN